MLWTLPRALWWCQHNVSLHFNKGICMTHTVINSGHGWAFVTAFCQCLFHHHQKCTMSRTVSIVLLGRHLPPPTGDQCPLLWDPSYARIMSHCVLQLLNMFPVDLMSLHRLHWYSMLMVPSRVYNKQSTRACFMVKCTVCAISCEMCCYLIL